MDVTLAQYIADQGENTGIKATINGQEMFVPISSSNRHYAAILEWVAKETQYRRLINAIYR